jgi:hypothetical protein
MTVTECTCLRPLPGRPFPPFGPYLVTKGCPTHDHGGCTCEWKHYDQNDGTFKAVAIQADAACPVHGERGMD